MTDARGAASRSRLALERGELVACAAATWRSLEALVEPATGLVADFIGSELAAGTRSGHTSPTNIGMYLIAALAARELGIITRAAALDRMARTLGRLAALERHAPSGQFYNWYSPATGLRLTRWPEAPYGAIHPFASSVDNAWLACALLMVAGGEPELASRARALCDSMSFAAYYDAAAKGAGPGLFRGGFWRVGESPPGSEAWPRGDYGRTGETVVYTAHHYGAFNAETRIASYIAIALGQVPREHYFAPFRAYPPTREHAWQEQLPVGSWRRYHGVDVFEGAYAHRGRRVVPSWGGSMFEALMVPLFVPEERWGPKSWAVNHELYVAAHIDFARARGERAYWGASPACDPRGGYREYGVPSVAMKPGRDALAREHVVTPHAVFLALDVAPAEALENLAALRRDFPALLGPGGYKDALDVVSGEVAERYLALDQGMILAAIANASEGDRLQSHLESALRPSLQPLMALEEFGAGDDAA